MRLAHERSITDGTVELTETHEITPIVISHHYAPLAALSALHAFGITLPHLSDEVLEHVVHMQVPLGRRLVERQPPALRGGLDSLAVHIALCRQVRFSAHDHYRYFLDRTEQQ